MPVAWRPKTDRIEQLIQAEEARIATLAERKFPEARVETPVWSPQPGVAPSFIGQERPPVEFEEEVKELPQPIVFPKPPAVSVGKEVEEKPVSIPLWQRALQVFGAPFEWVDENIIQPGLAMVGTTAGFVPETERKEGEDFWEWKKRSWQEWEVPSVDVNVAWMDRPWRIDIKGVLGFAPWLLLPGAGQVGTATRAATGIAGILSKVGKAGRILGTAVEYSPWGLVEKSAGVAIKGGIRAVGKVSENVSTKVGEALFGKYVPPPMSPAVAEFARLLKEVVIPGREAFEKVLPKELRARQEAAVQAARKEYLEGRLPLEELEKVESQSLAEIGALKPKFAITKEALAQRQADEIADVERRMAIGRPEVTPAPEVTPSGLETTITTPAQAQALKKASGSLAGFTDDKAFRRALGEGTESWDEAIYNQLKAGKSITVYRAAPLSEKEIYLGSRVTHSERSVKAIFDEMYLPSEAHILKTSASADDLIYQMPGEFIFVKRAAPIKPAIPKAEIPKVGKIIPEKGMPEIKGELGISEAAGKALITKIKKSPAFEFVPFEEAKVNELARTIMEASEYGLLNMDSRNALTRLLLGQADNLPEPHHIEQWKEVFGVQFAEAVGRFRTPQQINSFIDALNIPRSIIASWDISGTARQGLIFTLLHPFQVPVWFGRQIKALFSEKLALDLDDLMRADPLFKAFKDTGAYIAPLRGATFNTAEELFASRAARVIPGVRRSERAFATYLNQARFGSFKSAYNAMKAQGAVEADFKLLGEFLDIASGRGRFPPSFERFMPVFNLTLFSPRLQAATLQLPRQLGRMLLSDNPYMRKEAAKALITFVGGGVGLLTLLKNTSVAEVETDPRSGDFGKIKIGETRLDIWRGYLQYTRFAAQLLTGERKSAFGNMNKAERGEIVARFYQSKGSPALGLLTDLLRGETYMGKPIFNDTTGFISAAKEKVLPLALQDIIDAMEQGGVNNAWTAAPALLGVGALTYVNDFVRVKDKIAKEMGFELWDDIDPKTQREIQNRNTELQAATIAFDRQIMGTAWGDYRLAGNAIESVFRENVDSAVREYQETKDGVRFNERVSEAFTARRGGYAARDKEERFADIVKRKDTQNLLDLEVNLGPEQLAIKAYNDALFGEDMYDEFNNYRFDEARIRKEQLRQALGEEMMKYIEDYQEIKFETFPAEFQQLMTARDLMRPYWEVRTRVIKLFGERFAESSRGQALISKLRKQKRLANSDLELAFQQFYAKQ